MHERFINQRVIPIAHHLNRDAGCRDVQNIDKKVLVWLDFEGALFVQTLSK
jgi:hypothetical protein